MSSRKQTTTANAQANIDPEVLRLARQQAEQEPMPVLTPGQKGSLTKKYGKNDPEENWRKKRTEELIPVVANRLSIASRIVTKSPIVTEPETVKPVQMYTMEPAKRITVQSGVPFEIQARKVVQPMETVRLPPEAPKFTGYKHGRYLRTVNVDKGSIKLFGEPKVKRVEFDGDNDDDIEIPKANRQQVVPRSELNKAKKDRMNALSGLRLKKEKIAYLVNDEAVVGLAREMADGVDIGILSKRQQAKLKQHNPGLSLEEAFRESTAKKIAKEIAERYLSGDTEAVDTWFKMDVEPEPDFEQYGRHLDPVTRKTWNGQSLSRTYNYEGKINADYEEDIVGSMLDSLYDVINIMRMNADPGIYNVEYGLTFESSNKRGTQFIPLGRIQVDLNTNPEVEYQDNWEFGTGWVTKHIRGYPEIFYLDEDSLPKDYTGVRVYCVPHNENPKPKRLAKNPIENCLVALLRYKLGPIVDEALSRDALTADLLKPRDQTDNSGYHRYTYIGMDVIDRISELCNIGIRVHTKLDNKVLSYLGVDTGRKSSAWAEIGGKYKPPEYISIISDDEHARIAAGQINVNSIAYVDDMSRIARYHPRIIEDKPARPDYSDEGYVIMDDGILYKSFKPSSVTGNDHDDDNMALSRVTSARSLLFKLFISKHEIRYTSESMVPIIKRSLRWIGAFQADGPEERISIDHNSSYCAYETSKYYIGFPSHALVAVVKEMARCPAFYVCRSITPSPTMKKWWLSIYGSAHNVLPAPLYKWAIDNGFDINVDYILDDVVGLRKISIVGFYNKYAAEDDEPNSGNKIKRSEIKLARNSAIGCLIRGGVDGNKKYHISTSSLEEFQHMVNTCEKERLECVWTIEKTRAVGASESEEIDNYHLEITRKVENRDGMYHVYSYILAYSQIAVLSKIVETMDLNPIGYRVDCIYYPNTPDVIAQLENKTTKDPVIGGWKMSKIVKPKLRGWEDKADRFKPLPDIQLCDYEVPRNKTLLTGPAGISKSYKFTTKPPLGSMVLTPTVLLAAFHNSKFADQMMDADGFGAFRAKFERMAAEAVQNKKTYRLPKLAYTAAKVFQFSKEGEWFSEMVKSLPSASIYFIDEAFLYNREQWNIIHERVGESIIVAMGDPYQINACVKGDPMTLDDFIGFGYTETRIERDPAITHYRHDFEWGSRLDVIRVKSHEEFEFFRGTLKEGKVGDMSGDIKKSELALAYSKNISNLFTGSGVEIYGERGYDAILEDDNIIKSLAHIIVGRHNRGNKINQKARQIYEANGWPFPVRIVCKQIPEVYHEDDFEGGNAEKYIGSPVTHKNLCKLVENLTDDAFRKLVKASMYSCDSKVPRTDSDGLVHIKGQIVRINVNDTRIWWGRKACEDVVPPGYDYEAAYAVTADCLQGSTKEIKIGIDLRTLNRHGALYSAVTRTTRPELNVLILPVYKQYDMGLFFQPSWATAKRPPKVCSSNLSKIEKYRSSKGENYGYIKENWTDSCARVFDGYRYLSYTAPDWSSYSEFIRAFYSITTSGRNLNEFVAERSLPARFFVDVDAYLDQHVTKLLVDNLKEIFSGPIDVLRNDSSGKLHILTDVTLDEKSLDSLVKRIYEWDVRGLPIGERAYITKWIADRKWLSLKDIKRVVAFAVRNYLWQKFEPIFVGRKNFDKIIDVTAPGLRAAYTVKIDEGVFKPSSGRYVITDSNFDCIRPETRDCAVNAALKHSIYAPTNGRLSFEDTPIVYYIEGEIKALLKKRATNRSLKTRVTGLTSEKVYLLQEFLGLDLRDAPEYDIPISGSIEEGLFTQKMKLDAEAINTMLEDKSWGKHMKTEKWSSVIVPKFKKIYQAIKFDPEKLFDWYEIHANKHSRDANRNIWSRAKYEWDTRSLEITLSWLIGAYIKAISKHPFMNCDVEYESENTVEGIVDYADMRLALYSGASYDCDLCADKLDEISEDVPDIADKLRPAVENLRSAAEEAKAVFAGYGSDTYKLNQAIINAVQLLRLEVPSDIRREISRIRMIVDDVYKMLDNDSRYQIVPEDDKLVEPVSEPVIQPDIELYAAFDMLNDKEDIDKVAKKDITRGVLAALVSRGRYTAKGWHIVNHTIVVEGSVVPFEEAMMMVNRGQIKLPSDVEPLYPNKIDYSGRSTRAMLFWEGTDDKFEVDISGDGYVTYRLRPMDVKCIVDAASVAISSGMPQAVKYPVARRESVMFGCEIPRLTIKKSDIKKPAKPSTQYNKIGEVRVDAARHKAINDIQAKVDIAKYEYRRDLWSVVEAEIDEKIENGEIDYENRIREIVEEIDYRVDTNGFGEVEIWAAEEAKKVNDRMDKRLVKKMNGYQRAAAEMAARDMAALEAIKEDLKKPLPVPKKTKEEIAATRTSNLAAARKKRAESRRNRAQK